MEAVDKWLPKLSEHLYYEPKTYPVIVHGFPTPLNAASGAGSEGSDDLTSIIVDHNIDIITNAAALKQAKFLGSGQDQLLQRMASHGPLLLQFTDPAVANEIIERHVVFEGALLPAAKFIHSPPQCFNCQQVGHIAHH